ncbi:response regulator transcription factor [Kitasatospora sp. NPDC005856]|uniref:response regulator transcription factor n=1 Tax=Kitasatospora sp. NPDC005856 TaxID=3154566 RepID=UPI0033F198A9
MTETQVRVLAADDHVLLRTALCNLLTRESDITVVGEAGDGPMTVQQAIELRPDVILLDLEMPGPGPIETVRQLRTAVPDTRVVVLTMHDDGDLVHALLSEGAFGYLHKSATREVLLAAVRSAVAGGTTLFTPQRTTAPRPPLPADQPDAQNLLTSRELEVLTCVAEAMSNRQIGRRLGITEGTVKRHLRNIFAKLEATTRLDAVNKAQSARLIGR